MSGARTYALMNLAANAMKKPDGTMAKLTKEQLDNYDIVRIFYEVNEL